MKKNKKLNKDKKGKRKKSFSSSILIWRNINLGLKYVIAFSITIALFLTATVIVYMQLNNAKKDVNSIIVQGEFSNDLAQIALLIERKDSFVSNYILQNNNAIVDDYRRITEELNTLLDKVEPLFNGEGDNVELMQIRANSDDIDDLFLNTIINKDIDRDEHIRAQIRVDTRKISSVSLLNRLIIEVTEEQNNIVTETNQNLDKNNMYLAIANILALIIGTIVVIVISKSISTNLHRVVSMTSKLAQGDLTVSPVDYKGQDEIGQLAKSVNSLRESMHNVISEVTHASQSVTDRSESLTESAKAVQTGSEQVVLTMDELATGAESQATGASNLSESMQQFVQTIYDSQNEGQKMMDESQGVLRLTSEGTSLMEQSVSQMERIDTIVSDAVEKVQGLDEQSGQISHLVQVVKEIADQTNLLSLNAAIEAARAGEHGRGFAVVADEVGQLADEVANSVSEITNIVNRIQSETNNVVSSLNEGYSEVEEGIAQIEKTGQSFRVIDSSISGMVNNISVIASQLNDVAQSSETMNELIEDIAAVSEEAAAGVEQSAASVQESTSAMDEVARNASELEELAQQLHKEIARFRL